MHLIIDGYNVLGLTRRLSDRLESSRQDFLWALASYQHRTRHSITVVFDGWLHGQPKEQREHQAGVEVIYSKRGEKADQVIQRLVREYGSDCAIVSSDHEIVNVARSHRALVMGAQEFAGKMSRSVASVGAVPHKELDEGDDTRPDRGPKKKGNPRKLPKSQRRLQAQLKRF
jgi:predicted RNA-binding protein with PIN domain